MAVMRGHGPRIAVRDPERSISLSYDTLDDLANHFVHELLRSGVKPGDRVGLCAPKSPAAVAAALAILRTGAAYVPVDAHGPSARGRFILDDCKVRAVIVDPESAATLYHERPVDGNAVTDNAVFGDSAEADLRVIATLGPHDASLTPDLAYILYTSGSTGHPKGVMHTHESGLAFLDWCRDRFSPVVEDRFSSHAPLHFDLSIHDIWLPLTTGASVVLLSEATGKSPIGLSDFVSTERISVWYSTPSILRLMMEYGRLDEKPCPELRTVLFAGEVFAVKHLRNLVRTWAGAEFFNLYGPTETNVCTYFPIPVEIAEQRDNPFPIGIPCSGATCRVVDPEGVDVESGEVGELWVAGPSVTAGYWNLPQRDAESFTPGPDGRRWYHTGDLVREEAEAGYVYHGRNDRMVKRRGYRVELGEVEAGLYTHQEISEVAITASLHDEEEVRIQAWIVWGGVEDPSVVAMKQFSAQQLPSYMIPDTFHFLTDLPRTSTDKIDYQELGSRTS